MKIFNIMRVHWEIQFLRGVHEKLIYRGEMTKKRGLAKMGAGVFVGLLIP